MKNEKPKFDVGDFVKVIHLEVEARLDVEFLLGKHGIITAQTPETRLTRACLQVFLAGFSGPYYFEEKYLELVAKA